MISFIGLNITILNSNNKIVHRIWENHIASYLWKGIFHWSKPLTDKALLAFLKNEGLPRCLCGPIILLSYCNNHITSLNQDNTSQNKQTKTTLRIKKKRKERKRRRTTNHSCGWPHMLIIATIGLHQVSSTWQDHTCGWQDLWCGKFIAHQPCAFRRFWCP